MSWHSSLGRMSAIITILPSTMFGGWVIGHYVVDRLLPISPWGGIVMTLLGALAGFVEIFRLLLREQRGGGSGGRNDGART
jgi:F0F1-type ATP synthase assembly protein I